MAGARKTKDRGCKDVNITTCLAGTRLAPTGTDVEQDGRHATDPHRPKSRACPLLSLRKQTTRPSWQQHLRCCPHKARSVAAPSRSAPSRSRYAVAINATAVHMQWTGLTGHTH